MRVNSAGTAIAPWSVLAPALAITMLAIGITLLSDAAVAHLDRTDRSARSGRSGRSGRTARVDRVDRAAPADPADRQ